MAGIDTLTWVDGDAITAEKLQMMVQELRQLRIDLPNIKIQDERNGNVPLSSLGNSFKLVAGTTYINPNPLSQTVRQDIKFAANSFTEGNSPIVIATLSTTNRVRAFCTVSGPGGTTPNPTAQGFSVWVAHQILPPNAEGEPQELTINTTQTVFWLAIGY